MTNIEWIKDIIYLLPIAGLIWKAATLSSKVKQNEIDIQRLRENSTTNTAEILKKLDTISEKLNAVQIDIALLKDFKEKQEVEK